MTGFPSMIDLSAISGSKISQLLDKQVSMQRQTPPPRQNPATPLG